MGEIRTLTNYVQLIELTQRRVVAGGALALVEARVSCFVEILDLQRPVVVALEAAPDSKALVLDDCVLVDCGRRIWPATSF